MEDSQGDSSQLSPEESPRLIDDAIGVIDEAHMLQENLPCKKIVSLKISTASCAGKWGEN